MDNELINNGFDQTREGNYKKATSPLDYDLTFKKRKDQITSKNDEDIGVPWAEEGADRGSRMDTQVRLSLHQGSLRTVTPRAEATYS